MAYVGINYEDCIIVTGTIRDECVRIGKIRIRESEAMIGRFRVFMCHFECFLSNVDFVYCCVAFFRKIKPHFHHEYIPDFHKADACNVNTLFTTRMPRSVILTILFQTTYELGFIKIAETIHVPICRIRIQQHEVRFERSRQTHRRRTRTEFYSKTIRCSRN